MSALRYLLDTNILSAFAREPHGILECAFSRHAPQSLCTSIIVACEVQFGLCRGASNRIRERMQEILATLTVVPLEAPVDVHYGEIRAHLQSIGQPIGSNELFIAAQARALGLVLVTNNLKEFRRVPGLAVEDWLSAP